MNDIQNTTDHLTDQQFQQLHDILLRERKKLLRSHDELREALEAGGRIDDEAGADNADIAASLAEQEQASRMASRSGQRLAAIHDTLERMSKGEEFGRCQHQNCGEPISFDRLEILPTTQQCQKHAG